MSFQSRLLFFISAVTLFTTTVYCQDAGADRLKRRDKRETAHYIVTSIVTTPFLMIKSHGSSSQPLTGNDRYDGYCVDLMEKLAEVIGINYTIRLVRDGKYGSKAEDGNWNGMVGELTRREADLAVAPLTVTAMRERVIDFAPYMQHGITILIKKPERHVRSHIAVIFEPFSAEVWFGLLCTFLVVGLATFIVARISPVERKRQNKSDGDNFTFLNSLWYTLRSMLYQGATTNPRSIALRMLSAIWWFFALVVIVCYVGSLFSLLSVRHMVLPIQSADDLAKQTEIKYGTLSGGATKEFFRTSKIAVYERMWSFMSQEPDVFTDTTEEGIERVRRSDGKYAFLLESTMTDYHAQRKPCNVMKVGSHLNSNSLGVATPLGSPLRDRVRLALLQLQETGFLAKLHKKWWYDKGECSTQPSEDDGPSQMMLASIHGLFLLLFLGLLLSVVVAVIEMLVASIIESRRTKTGFSQVLQSNVRQICKSTPKANEPVSRPL